MDNLPDHTTSVWTAASRYASYPHSIGAYGLTRFACRTSFLKKDKKKSGDFAASSYREHCPQSFRFAALMWTAKTPPKALLSDYGMDTLVSDRLLSEKIQGLHAHTS